MAAMSEKSNHLPARVSASKIITKRRSRIPDSGFPKYATGSLLEIGRGGTLSCSCFFINKSSLLRKWHSSSCYRTRVPAAYPALFDGPPGSVLERLATCLCLGCRHIVTPKLCSTDLPETAL